MYLLMNKMSESWGIQPAQASNEHHLNFFYIPNTQIYYVQLTGQLVFVVVIINSKKLKYLQFSQIVVYNDRSHLLFYDKTCVILY